MKRYIIMVALMSFMGASLHAQDIRREGKTYIEQSKSKTTKSEVKTGYTYKDSKGNIYDIYVGTSGSCYINKVSQKSGKTYRKYLGEQISREICNSIGHKYESKQKKS